MAEQGSTLEDPTELMTTSAVETTQQTATGSSVTSSMSRGVDFYYYFQCAVVVIGVVGTAANALILYAMVASRQHKKQVLIFNQNLLDCTTCFFVVVTYVVKLCNIRLTGRSGYWLCVMFFSENFIWSPSSGSTINLAAISIERYLKVVHSTWSKNKLRKWVIYTASACAWIFGTALTFGVTIPTSDVIDGICYPYLFWESKEAQLAYGIGLFLLFEVTTLAIFIFCYWRILVVIRRQAKVMAGHHGAGPSTSQARQSSKIQSNVIKTMIIVSIFFAISWTPFHVLNLLMITGGTITSHSITIIYVAIFIPFFYISTNPFIYATKFDPVKRVLLGLIPCQKNTVQPVESIELTPKQT